VPVATRTVSAHALSLRAAALTCRGFCTGLLAGGIIGLPPVMNFGRPEIQQKVIPEVLQCKKFICLAISEAFAGSDVTGMAIR
jgi:alkylation response protein AidB-like acyl-CoA dehydrogenase